MNDKKICNNCGHDESACTFDELYRRAKEMVTFKQFCSAGMLQRELKISYPKAAAVILLMEEEGFVEPSDGTARPRKLNPAP